MKIRDLGSGLSRQITFGKVVKPHGIKGEIKVFPYSENPDDLKRCPEIILFDAASGVSRAHKVLGSRGQGKVVILKLAGIEGRDAAEQVRGLEVRIAREKAPSPEAGEYFWHDLEGLRVVTDSGRDLGVITGFLATPAHDILVVTGQGGQEYMIPLTEEFVSHKDEAAPALVITPPPGLLEMNE